MAKRPITLDAESVQLTYSLYVVLAYEYFESCDLFERLLMVNCHHQTPAQVTCAHCQRSRTSASAPRPFHHRPGVTLLPKRAAHHTRVFVAVNTLRGAFFTPADKKLGSGSMILAGLLQDSKRHFTISPEVTQQRGAHGRNCVCRPPVRPRNQARRRALRPRTPRRRCAPHAP